MISFHVWKVAPVFISIQSINLHAMRFLIAMNKRSSSLSLSFFNFIRMQFDLPTKTDFVPKSKKYQNTVGSQIFWQKAIEVYLCPTADWRISQLPK